MKASIEAYKTVCKHLGVKPAEITEVYPEKDGHSLVIVPDQVFGYKKLIKLAQAFGKDQPYETWVYEKLYKLYSSTALSGNPTGKAYRALYIPHKDNVKSDTVANQKRDNPGHVPSVLEAIAYWYTLREAGESLDLEKTYIRHFDLEPKAIVGWSRVPFSYVNYVGKPYLGIALAVYEDKARLAVGVEASVLESSALPSAISFSSTELQANTEALNRHSDLLERIFKVEL